MTELQKNHKNHCIYALKTIASSEDMIAYEKAVPYVNVPVELKAQWDAIARVRDRVWFQSIFSNAERAALWKFDRVIDAFFRQVTMEVRNDLTKLLADKGWQEVQQKAIVTLAVLGN